MALKRIKISISTKSAVKEIMVHMVIFAVFGMCLIHLLGYSTVHVHGRIEGNMTMQRLGLDAEVREINLTFNGEVPLLFAIHCNEIVNAINWER